MKNTMINSLGMKFIPINAGTFMMGDAPESKYQSHSSHQRRIKLSNSFHVQDTTVTVEQWQHFVNETGYQTEAEREGGWTWILVPQKNWKLHWLVTRNDWVKSAEHSWRTPGFSQNHDHPVTCISWSDALQFIEWLNQKESAIYRLPTEAEWEYVCRAGTKTDYFFGDRLLPVQARYYSHLVSVLVRVPMMDHLFNINRTVSVTSFEPNAWGVYNMHGNVWEWCDDHVNSVSDESPRIYSDINNGSAADPHGQNGNHRVLRGGSWAYPDSSCRSAHRRIELPEYKASGIGFRLVQLTS